MTSSVKEISTAATSWTFFFTANGSVKTPSFKLERILGKPLLLEGKSFHHRFLILKKKQLSGWRGMFQGSRFFNDWWSTVYQREVTTIRGAYYWKVGDHVLWDPHDENQKQNHHWFFRIAHHIKGRRWQHDSYSDSIGSQELPNLKIGLTKKNSPLTVNILTSRILTSKLQHNTFAVN